MATITSIEILKRFNLRPTDGRKEILDVIRQASYALSHPEIESKLPIRLDRITTYRTLQSFKKKGIIHSIIDPHSGTARYLYTDANMPGEHAHFKCITCGIVVCLTGKIEGAGFINVPPDYKAMQYSFVIEGLCSKCT